MKDHPKRAASSDEVRCRCAKLLARQTPEGYELKCARCKALWLLPKDAGSTPLVLEISRRERS